MPSFSSKSSVFHSASILPRLATITAPGTHALFRGEESGVVDFDTILLAYLAGKYAVIQW